MSGQRISGRAFVPQIFAYSREYFATDSYRQLWYVPQAGGSPVQVTNPTGDGDFDTDPDVSPDGSQIVFLRRTSFGSYTLWVIGANGAGATQIDSTAGCSAPMWSPAGDLIVYRIGATAYTIRPDGSDKTTLAPSGVVGAVRRPTWNRDGTLIAFQVEQTGGTTPEELWVMDADGANAAKLDDLANTGLGGLGISWANGSDVVAYTRGTGDNDVYTIDADGTGKAAITTGTITSPALTRYAWSPDDSTVYGIKDGSAPWAWYKIPAAGSGESLLDSTVPSATVGEGQAWVAGSRVYTVDDDENLVSVALDGSDPRAEDGDSFSTFFCVVQGNTTGL